MTTWTAKVGLRKPRLRPLWPTDVAISTDRMNRIQRAINDWFGSDIAYSPFRAVPYDQGGVIGGSVVVTNDTYEPIEVRTADEPYVPEWLKGTFESSRRRLDGVHAALADDHQHCTCTFHTECCYCAGREH